MQEWGLPITIGTFLVLTTLFHGAKCFKYFFHALYYVLVLLAVPLPMVVECRLGIVLTITTT